MTIQQAIEILSHSAYAGVTTHNHLFKQALKLAIEALIQKAEREKKG